MASEVSDLWRVLTPDGQSLSSDFTVEALFGLMSVTTSTLLQILGILRLSKQKERNAHNKNFISVPSWSISSVKIESGPGAFPGFRCWRADISSSTRIAVSHREDPVSHNL